MRILAVDDDQILLGILNTALQKAGYTDITFANSAEEALEKIDTAPRPFECFLLDIQMPEVDGIDLCRMIRARNEYMQTPIIMITRLSDKAHIDKAFAARATDYVTKPFDDLELASRIRLAERLNTQQNSLRAQTAQVAELRHQIDHQNTIDLTAPMQLDDVVGGIDYLAMQNYLLQMTGGIFKLNLFAVKVTNITDAYARASASEFRLMVNSAADVIGECLKSREFFLSYAGNGVFPVVVQGRAELDMERLQIDLGVQGTELDFDLTRGRSIQLDLTLGTPANPKLLSKGRVLDALNEAISNAEAARHIEAVQQSEKAAAGWHPLSFFSRVRSDSDGPLQ